MAYNDSGELPKEQSQYDLGGYSFELKVQNVHEPGEPDVTSVFAICHSPDGSRETVPMDFPAGTTVDSWRVEANETEATVYATITNKENNPWDIPSFTPVIITELPYSTAHKNVYSIPVHFIKTNKYTGVAAASSFFTEDDQQGYIYNARNWTYDGKTVYWIVSADNGMTDYPIVEIAIEAGKLAWQMIYGSFEDETTEQIIARFAIDIREADGGPDGDWDEPGDVGPDPEKHYTLTVSVIGASAGSNNGTPLEAGQAGGYGDGGTGGNGGGGGAGASTVIIYEFATDKAGTVNQEATAQGPGTGGPGGKGGKGGDGCILIFY